jgi:hypothetical protein
MVMGRGSRLDGVDDWAGFYIRSTDNIAIYRPLVEQWELAPKNKVLYRGLVAVVLHELVHYFNDQVLPGSLVHSEPGHLRDTFHREAFAPLGWDRAHYGVIKEVLEIHGVH